MATVHCALKLAISTLRIRQRAKRPLKNLVIRTEVQKIDLIFQRDVICCHPVVQIMAYGLIGIHVEDSNVDMRVKYANVLLLRV